MPRVLRSLLFAAGLGLGLAPSAAEAVRVHGATVPDDARSLGGGRFQSTKDWDKTVSFFRSAHPNRAAGIVWRPLETNQKVSGFHIENTRRDRSWDGINVYQTEDGKIFISVLEAKPEVRGTPAATKKR